jgi:hypothetical protein
MSLHKKTFVFQVFPFFSDGSQAPRDSREFLEIPVRSLLALLMYSLARGHYCSF